MVERIFWRTKLEATSLECCFRSHSGKGHSNRSLRVGGIHFSLGPSWFPRPCAGAGGPAIPAPRFPRQFDPGAFLLFLSLWFSPPSLNVS